jgi:hypothetical protein
LFCGGLVFLEERTEHDVNLRCLEWI